MELTNSFANLLLTFSPVFTEPSFVTFRLLMTGWIVSMRHRYITDMISLQRLGAFRSLLRLPSFLQPCRLGH